MIRHCELLPCTHVDGFWNLRTDLTCYLIRFSPLFHSMRSVLDEAFSEVNHEIRSWVQVIYLGSASGSWRKCGPSSCPTAVRGRARLAVTCTEAPRALNWPPEHHGCRFTSAFQISRTFFLVAKPNVYTRGEGILENVAPAKLCQTLYKSPEEGTQSLIPVPQVPLTEQYFLCFPYQLSFCLWALFRPAGKIFNFGRSWCFPLWDQVQIPPSYPLPSWWCPSVPGSSITFKSYHWDRHCPFPGMPSDLVTPLLPCPTWDIELVCKAEGPSAFSLRGFVTPPWGPARKLRLKGLSSLQLS